MEFTERQCLYCGETLRGRIDKKFCNDACRNSYNNERNSDSNNLMRNINRILRKNRHILKSCIPKNEETGRVKRERMLQKGYQFKYLTHQFENHKGQTYTFCYEYGFLPMDENWFLIVKKREKREDRKRRI